MIDAFVSSVQSLITLLPFTGATWFVIAIILFLVWLFSKAHKDERGNVAWEDLILDPETNRVTPYKLGYLIGLVVSTWLIITLTDKSSLTFDLFGLYLSYLLGGAGWSEFINKRGKGGMINRSFNNRDDRNYDDRDNDRYSSSQRERERPSNDSLPLGDGRNHRNDD